MAIHRGVLAASGIIAIAAVPLYVAYGVAGVYATCCVFAAVCFVISAILCCKSAKRIRQLKAHGAHLTAAAAEKASILRANPSLQNAGPVLDSNDFTTLVSVVFFIGCASSSTQALVPLGLIIEFKYVTQRACIRNCYYCFQNPNAQRTFADSFAFTNLFTSLCYPNEVRPL